MAEKVLLVGSGYMAREYGKVLKSLNVPYVVIGRGEESAARYETELSEKVHRGGLEKNIELARGFKKAFVLADDDVGAGLASKLLELGTKSILIEKPGGIDLEDIARLSNAAKKYQGDIRVAYNRRFFAPVLTAKKMIQEDGGVTSFHFEFTEWSARIGRDVKNQILLKNWLVANSSHVIDMAFYFGGTPKDWKAYSRGKLSWHDASIFVGAGISDLDIPFTYHANWESGGRWGLEVMTNKRKYIFRPLEQLQIQERESVKIEPYQLDDSLDKKFKPGLYLQTQAFLESNYENLIDIHHQREMFEVYDKILHGTKA